MARRRARTQAGRASTSRERLRQARAQVARIGGLAAAVVILALIFSYRTNGQMLQVDNLLGIVRAVSTIAIMSLGLLVVIVAGEIDLSFANLYGLCTNVTAVLWLTHGVPVYLVDRRGLRRRDRGRLLQRVLHGGRRRSRRSSRRSGHRR